MQLDKSDRLITSMTIDSYIKPTFDQLIHF
jgi:hypothetical protein